MQNPKTELIKAMDSGASPEDLKKKYSTKTIFKYKKLFICIQIKRKLQTLIDADGWTLLNLPDLKQMLSEVERW
jgi:hypothetical protein